MTSPVPAAASLVEEAAGVVGRVRDAAGNLADYVRHGRLADVDRTPRAAVVEGVGWTLHRYAATTPHGSGAPVLLVPPLGAPDFAFDLRRGASLVRFLLDAGRDVWIVTYAASFWFGHRRGLETWVDGVVPTATRAVTEATGHDVHLVGWSLGGLFVLLADAAAEGAGSPLPAASLSAFASPVDVAAVPMVAPFRSVAEYTGGAVFTAAYRTLGSFPAAAVRLAFQLVSVERYVTKPVTVLTHLDDRELLEQIEAVDLLMENMTAYPGRAFGQLYHQVIRSNDLADDRLELAGRHVRLADVRAPVLLIAGSDDIIAPQRAVARGAELLTASSDPRFVVAPGGHLGVLTGRRARTHAWRALLDFLADHDDVSGGQPVSRG